MPSDPINDEIRRIRHDLAAPFGNDLDLILAETLLRVLDRYGEPRDLTLLQAIGSEEVLAGFGPDRSRLEEAVQRIRARLSAER